MIGLSSNYLLGVDAGGGGLRVRPPYNFLRYKGGKHTHVQHNVNM